MQLTDRYRQCSNKPKHRMTKAQLKSGVYSVSEVWASLQGRHHKGRRAEGLRAAGSVDGTKYYI